ncbi:MAG: alpha/beta fold hydrolase [Candidatus Hydrogenedentes bacterium]|nr:alpha/beta fold hydrolase [Candidatus Hydrogenedentota bacterium]
MIELDNYGGEAWGSPEGIEAVAVRSTAYYVTQAPDRGVGPNTTPLVVLHGWGQSAPSFMRRFRGLAGSDVLVVAMQGPHQIYLDRDTRKVGFSWLTAFDRRRGVADFVNTLDTVMARVRADFGVNAPPYVLGFSQGVSMAYRYAILSDMEVAGVIACGGDLPPDVADAMPGARRFPVLLVHGRDDAIVPESKCDEAESALAGLSWPHERFSFSGDHEVPSEVVERIAEWIMRDQGIS